MLTFNRNKKIILILLLMVLVLLVAGRVIYTSHVHGSRIIFDIDIGKTEKINDVSDKYAYSAEWKQPAGYSAFKIWSSNISDEEITVKITSIWGYNKEYKLMPGYSGVIDINNNAHNVTYKISFISGSEIIRGNFSVRAAAYDFDSDKI